MITSIVVATAPAGSWPPTPPLENAAGPGVVVCNPVAGRGWGVIWSLA